MGSSASSSQNIVQEFPRESILKKATKDNNKRQLRSGLSHLQKNKSDDMMEHNIFFSPLFSFKQLKTTFCKVKDLWGTDLTPWTISGSRIRPQLPDLLGDVTCDEKGNFQLRSLCMYIYLYTYEIYVYI